jgi:ornithine decarboxylase
MVDFDCASLQEVYAVKKLYWARDDKPSKILYAHPLKSERDIRTINDMGICGTVVDSVEEVKKLEKCGWKGSALVRVAVGDSGSKMPFSSKFGATAAEVEEICKVSKVPLIGASFHVGSGCDDVTQYTEAMKYVSKDIFDIFKKYSHKTRILDIGGGFSAETDKFQSSAAAIRNGLDFVTQNTKVIAEPGRFFAQPSQDLFVKVIAKKPGRNGGWRYVIDESLYGQFSCIPFDHQKPVWFRVKGEKEPDREMEEGVLFGRTCDSLDVIGKGKMERLEVGDWLWFPMMGAYTSATASEFNGFPKPDVLVDHEKALPSGPATWDLIKQALSTTEVKFSNPVEPLA